MKKSATTEATNMSTTRAPAARSQRRVVMRDRHADSFMGTSLHLHGPEL